ncbi:MAG: hypothetical protein HOL31_02000 [Candidatus Scalindua sp.]|jgi:hypothetical protein|nr:hypothetical protein [Candidatus Scalindua sp.]MBT7350544.1 hypothetical protein [candidate division WWE3 bacterium]
MSDEKILELVGIINKQTEELNNNYAHINEMLQPIRDAVNRREDYINDKYANDDYTDDVIIDACTETLRLADKIK